MNKELDLLLFDEIHDLASQVLEGNDCEGASERLEKLLVSSKQARQIYFDYLAETSVLRSWASRELGEFSGDQEAIKLAIIVDGVDEHLTSDQVASWDAIAAKEKSNPPKAVVNTIMHSTWPKVVGSLIAFVLMVVATIGIFYSPKTTDEETTVAEVVAQNSARWSDGNPVTVGTRLALETLALEEGLVEIVFDDGAHVILEGGVEFELVSASRLRINHGRVSANVPDIAKGFTIDSAAASIVDLGTGFGVEVAESGETKVQVFEGEVVLTPSTQQGRGRTASLKKGRAVKIGIGQNEVSETEFDRSAFILEIPETERELAILIDRPLAYWRMNRGLQDDRIESRGQLAIGGIPGPGATLKKLSDENRGVLQFEGNHSGVDFGNVENFALSKSFSVEAWVRCPESINAGSVLRLISTFNDQPRTGFAFGVAGDGYIDKASTKAGPANELLPFFTFFGNCDYASTTGFQPGEWVHLAAVVDEKGVATLYLNGKPENIVARVADTDGVFRTLDPLANSKDHVDDRNSVHLFVGQNPISPGINFPVQRWQGVISDLAVFDRVLEPQEIVKHFEADPNE